MTGRKGRPVTQTNISVAGMTCGHCVSAVKQELARLPGVSDVVVELGGDEPSMVSITSARPLSAAEISAAVDEAGYTVTA